VIHVNCVQGCCRMCVLLTSILLREDTSEAPGRVLERLHILNVYDQDITGLGSLDLEWSGQVMDLGQVDVADVVGRVVVLDLTTGPVDTLDLDRLAVFNGTRGGDWLYVRSWVRIEICG
jgi:hypothetical protein